MINPKDNRYKVTLWQAKSIFNREVPKLGFPTFLEKDNLQLVFLCNNQTMKYKQPEGPLAAQMTKDTANLS